MLAFPDEDVLIGTRFVDPSGFEAFTSFLELEDVVPRPGHKANVEFAKKIKTMPTDPARVKRTDPGVPEKCPVWQFHQVYSSAETKDWVVEGCTTAGIGFAFMA